MRRFLLAPILLSCCTGNAQYSGPESVEYDPVGDRYFVSCLDDNSIKQRAQDGTVTPFASGISASPYGIELHHDTLYACVGGGVQGFMTGDGSLTFGLDLGATFLNGITSDGEFLYVTDFSAKRIYKVSPLGGGAFTTLVASTVQTPNGIVYDPVLDKLWVAFWGSNARIKSYDKNSGAELSTFTTSLGNIDGIALDCQGRILVSSWSPARITRFENTFIDPAEILINTGLSSPADIDYDAVHGRVCIPNGGTNTVIVPQVADCSTGIAEEAGYETIAAVPNPTDGLVRIDLPIIEAQPFMVLTEAGLLVASGTLRPRAMLDISNLAAGIYLVDLPRIKRYVRVVKQ